MEGKLERDELALLTTSTGGGGGIGGAVSPSKDKAYYKSAPRVVSILFVMKILFNCILVIEAL